MMSKSNHPDQQNLHDFLSPISAKHYIPKGQVEPKQAPSEPSEKSGTKTEKPRRHPQVKNSERTKTRQSKKRTIQQSTKILTLTDLDLSHLDLNQLAPHELDALTSNLQTIDLVRIRMNKRVLLGLKLALKDGKHTQDLLNTVGLLFLQMFRPDILETILKS